MRGQSSFILIRKNHYLVTLALVSPTRNRRSRTQKSIFTKENHNFLVQMAPQASWPPDVPAESLEARSPRSGVLSQVSSARIPQPGGFSKDSSARRSQLGVLSQDSSAKSPQPGFLSQESSAWGPRWSHFCFLIGHFGVRLGFKLILNQRAFT